MKAKDLRDLLFKVEDVAEVRIAHPGEDIINSPHEIAGAFVVDAYTGAGNVWNGQSVFLYTAEYP